MKQFLAILLAISALQLTAQEDSIQRKIFKLGEITITETQNTSPLQSIDQKEIEQFSPDNAAQALNLLPGVTMSQSGGRNEALIFVRGYDLRRIPVFVDGLPVYIPYDGYIDLNRIQVGQLSKISVDKGFTSLLYGANTLGGAINLVSAKPSNNFELNAEAGSKISREGVNAYSGSINIGTRRKKWFAAGTFQIQQQEFYNLPGSFTTFYRETDYKRDNSQFHNLQYSLKAGYTPRKGDEYVLSIKGIKANKGVPIYLGNNPNIRVRYWRYPKWEKNGIYFHSKTKLQNQLILKTRWFADGYKNVLKSFDDSTYTSQTYNYAFTSTYDDQRMGGNIDLHLYSLEAHALKAGVRIQYDHHKAFNKGETPRHIKDLTTSAALEDIWQINDRLKLVSGIAFMSRKGLQADDYIAQSDSVVSFAMGHDKAWHYQAGIFYNLDNKQTLHASVARKTRFATMKDRYSYRIGRAIPNPDLNTENAINTEITYSGQKTSLQWSFSVFYNFIDNTIQRVDEVQNDLWQLQNTGKSHFRGGEVAIGWKANQFFSLGGSYAYLDQKNITNPDIKFVDIPAHQLQTYARLHWHEKFKTTAEVNYQSSRFSTSNGTYKAPQFTTINVMASYKILESLKIHLNVRNLTNELFYLTEGYPEAGRTYEIKLSYQLNR
ncbi:MAG TPA: TonB-dependent receptor [Salinivirga sp.]|uniref:TonB-dependent receptor plug domain-containing protein n=1 Tax=Salinivirga sp. TaxID=1970192 RepID=UPI002B4A1B36|nr:TonB-dependent receptor [Salinivirga sp.]HKK58880.1 TonB-dependent receptor [Salinivirga sp.]